MYLRINETDFGFVKEGIHEILPTDIGISDVEYNEFMNAQSAGKCFRLKQNFNSGGGMAGCIEEFTPDPIVLPKTENELLREELLNNKLVMAELVETIMGGGEIE